MLDDAGHTIMACRTVENALDVPYYPLMQDLNVKLNQMRPGIARYLLVSVSVDGCSPPGNFCSHHNAE